MKNSVCIKKTNVNKVKFSANSSLQSQLIFFSGSFTFSAFHHWKDVYKHLNSLYTFNSPSMVQRGQRSSVTPGVLRGMKLQLGCFNRLVQYQCKPGSTGCDHTQRCQGNLLPPWQAGEGHAGL